jgi:MarR family transcriptional regulator, organic hydroperoxide resistance regulator
MKRDPSPTQRAIKQEKAFRSLGQEAVVALFLTAEAIRWPFVELLAKNGDITFQQYNVLRILRGAGPGGLPTLEISERMIERTPGITRLLDRLEQKKLVERERCSEDRRLVYCRISREGKELLARLDGPFDKLDDQAFAALSNSDLKTFLRLLDRVRAPTSAS